MSDLIKEYKLVLGLEIHMHVKTSQKMFCGCSSDIYDAAPNTYTCPTCLGLPGALPVPSSEAIEKAQLLGLALGCTLNEHSRFDRKHYFYPDLPKGYQISQYKKPFCVGGQLELASGFIAKLERIHLEEDTAKSFHTGTKTLIDFNKSGMPLIELVTTPCFTTVSDAVSFCKKVHDLVRYLDVSDADMEKGQLRIEPNISLRTLEMEKKGELPKYKVEIKNINSFRFVEKAVTAEILRQTKLLDAGENIFQENRGYDEAAKTTVPQRSKEEAQDYRYFPEPDIPPFEFSDTYFSGIKATLPELPWEVKKDLMENYAIPELQADMFISGATIAHVPKFRELVQKGAEPVIVMNRLINRPEYAAASVDEFLERLKEEGSRVSDANVLETVVKEVLSENIDACKRYKTGNAGSLQFLIGQVMEKTRGKADPEAVKALFERML